MPAGRPTKYSKELAATICARIAEGESLRSICKEEDMPSAVSVYSWLFNEDYKEFLNNYEKSRQIQAETLADEITDIADDSTNDYMLKKHGDDEREVINPENIQRSRLRVDARKWVASKLLPKKYGDKIETTHRGTMKVVMTEDDANL